MKTTSIGKYFFFLGIVLLAACKNENGRFVKLDPANTNINFTNTITESDSINIFDFANIYNGGGVGVGDFNNDGQQHLYITGNMVSNKLYLNKGKMVFEDVTATSQTGGNGKWCRGVAVVDINNDGLLDMYVCATAKKDPLERKNILYVNQGLDKNKVPVFKDMAQEYGLADTTQSTMAYFFDYDNDGDLDLYIGVNHIINGEYANQFKKRNLHGEHPSTGRLFRNDWSDSLQHPVYTDVSRQAGILIEGYTHAVDIFDINNDGWMDMLVTNDYVSDNVLYINNHDGTFTDRVTEYFKHTAANSMGSDAADINNDGLEDVVEVDMAPPDNFRKKMFQSANAYQNYQNSDLYGYQYQYVRNMLQVNQGPSVGQQDSIQHPVFSDMGYFAGIAETDWSWTPLVADYDNDGNKDILFTNGFPKDITDHDFIIFRKQAFSLTTKKEMLAEIPEVKIAKYMYRNNGNLTFTDNSQHWGFVETAFSNGAVYADLDNDGDMDIIINNINDPAFVYENHITDGSKTHFLNIRFSGVAKNKNGIGAVAELHYNHGMQQVCRNMPYRGYISSVEQGVHFGLGNTVSVDTVLIKWPDGSTQLLQNVKADQPLTVNSSDARIETRPGAAIFAKNALFKEISDSVNIHFTHEEMDFVDFNIQKLLPHKFSEYGPGMAVADVDGNGLDDLIAGGTFNHPAQVFLQQQDQRFIQKALLPPGIGYTTPQGDDMGLLLFDADADGDADLYVSRGGYENQPGSKPYQDQLYINDGKGNYLPDSLALPVNFTSKSCVKAIDYDKDGDLDLFIGGRVEPWNYPKPVSSFIYRNDSKNGHCKFTDVTNEVAKDLNTIGLVCDAVFSDFDNDGWPDLILAGEWMPLTVLKNDKGVFKNITALSGLQHQTGWWNTLVAGDFDNDGDIDYIAGNLGENSFYKASDQYPITVYAKDFDNNGSYDAFPSVYLPASQADKTKREFPVQTRDDAVKQMIGLRATFQNYKSFAMATIDKLFTKEQLKNALVVKANNLKSCYIRNEGHGKFTLFPLPQQAQLSVLNGMVADDFDGDGNLDVLLNGNDYGTEVSAGRYDALNGLLLKGNGKGDFTAQSILQSGIYIPGNGKALVKLKSKEGKYLVAASQNRGRLKVFQLKRNINYIPLQPNDASARIKYKSGLSRKEEFYYGGSFLSQSSRFLVADSNMISITIADSRGNQRNVKF